MPVTNYIWDDENDSYLTETDDAGVSTAVYTNEPTQFGNLISQRRGNQTTYYHYDALGSTRELTDENENVVNTNLYDAWGVDVASSGQTDNWFKFNGEVGYYFDVELGINYVRSRQYVPTNARWLCPDPLWRPLYALGGLPYAYADNGPVNRVDPSGLLAVTHRRGLQHDGYDCPDCCCQPRKMDLRWKTYMTVKRTDDRTGIFIQEVDTVATLECGLKESPDWPCCVPCDTLSVRIREHFVEGFNPWSQTDLSIDDGHPPGNPQVLWDAINRACDPGCDICCEWKYTKSTTKRLVFAVATGMIPRTDRGHRAFRSCNDFHAEFRCCGTGALPRDVKELKSFTYPGAHTLVRGLRIPAQVLQDFGSFTHTFTMYKKPNPAKGCRAIMEHS